MSGQRKFWNDDRFGKLCELWDAGYSYRQIANYFGVSDLTISNARYYHKLPARKRGRPWTSKPDPEPPSQSAAISWPITKPVLPPSEISWPTPGQMMGRR